MFRLVPCVFLAASLCAQTPGSAGRIVKETVTSQALQGNLVGDSPNRTVLVYLPPSYEQQKNKRYPVVYLLHGNGGNPAGWTSERFDIRAEMDRLVADGQVREMIVVMPDANNKFHGSHYVNSVATGRWEDFIVQDLVGYIDGHYRTIVSSASRGLAGHSMGGRGALYLAMTHPGIFGAVYALSAGAMAFDHMEPVQPAIWKRILTPNTKPADSLQDFGSSRALGFAAAFSPNPDRPPFFADYPYFLRNGEPERIDAVWQRWLAHDPFALIASRGQNLRVLRAFQFDCGTEDALVRANQLFSDELKKVGIRHVFETYPGNHSNHVGDRIRAKVLPFFSKALER